MSFNTRYSLSLHPGGFTNLKNHLHTNPTKGIITAGSDSIRYAGINSRPEFINEIKALPYVKKVVECKAYSIKHNVIINVVDKYEQSLSSEGDPDWVLRVMGVQNYSELQTMMPDAHVRIGINDSRVTPSTNTIKDTTSLSDKRGGVGAWYQFRFNGITTDRYGPLLSQIPADPDPLNPHGNQVGDVIVGSRTRGNLPGGSPRRIAHAVATEVTELISLSLSDGLVTPNPVVTTWFDDSGAEAESYDYYEGLSYADDHVELLRYAVEDLDLDVINMSLDRPNDPSFDDGNPALEALQRIAEIALRKGVIFTIAAGNQRSSNLSNFLKALMPAAFRVSAISAHPGLHHNYVYKDSEINDITNPLDDSVVGSTTTTLTIGSPDYASTGGDRASIDYTMPGEDVIVSQPYTPSGVMSSSGSSISAPYLAGMIGLAIAKLRQHLPHRWERKNMSSIQRRNMKSFIDTILKSGSRQWNFDVNLTPLATSFKHEGKGTPQIGMMLAEVSGNTARNETSGYYSPVRGSLSSNGFRFDPAASGSYRSRRPVGDLFGREYLAPDEMVGRSIYN